MAGIGVFIVYLGYSLAYYGVDQIRGGNNGLLSLMIPGKYSAQPNDSGGAAGAPTAATSGGGVPASNGGSYGGGGTGGSSGISFWSPTSAPKGAPPGNYRVNQDGTIQVQTATGGWKTYSLPGGAPAPSPV